MKDLYELVKRSWMSVDDILLQVKEEFNKGIDYAESKRYKFDEDLKLYNNQKKNKNKIWDTTVYNVHSALMARLYLWKVDVSFEWVDVWDEYIMDNINASYKEDFEREDMEQIKFQRYWDALFFWVGIVAKTWWDWSGKKTTFENVDPRMWVPDPNWDYVNNNYSFTGFQKLISISEAKALWLYNEELVSENNWNYRDAFQIKRLDQQRAGLRAEYLSNKLDNNNYYNIYYHWSIFNWIKALIITGNNNSIILDVKILRPVFDSEKKNNSKIPFPFSFTYYRPERNNPFWKSVVDDTADVQRVKALIANLRLDKSKAELYPMYIYNTRLIKNRWDLDFGFNKMIGVNPLEWEPLDNVIKPIQKDFRADNSYLIEESLDAQVEKATSIWPIAQGSEARRRETATTNKIIQWNTDINLSLTAKIMNWWEKSIAELRYRWIIEHMQDWDKKYVKMYNGMTYVPMVLKKKDLISKDQYKITIRNELEVTVARQKQIQAFNMALPILQSLQLPEVSTNYLYRDFLRNLWYDEKKIWVAIPQRAEEARIMQDIALLKEGVEILPDESIDVDTALILLKQCPPSDNVEIYKMALLDMYTRKKKEIPLEQSMKQERDPIQESIRNNVVNQAGSSLQNMAQQFIW